MGLYYSDCILLRRMCYVSSVGPHPVTSMVPFLPPLSLLLPHVFVPLLLVCRAHFARLIIAGSRKNAEACKGNSIPLTLSLCSTLCHFLFGVHGCFL